MRSKLLFCFALLISASLFSFSTCMAGEPVPGAEILIEQEPNDEPIAQAISNNHGEFMFSFPEGMKIPKSGIFKITITPPQKLKGSNAKKLKGMDMEKQIIQIQFSRKDGPKFKYILIWDEKLKTKSNRGGFAVSGRNNA
jgi:hypothetical protein